MKPDYYEVLGVSRTATPEEIRKAYRGLAKSHHPDINRDDPEADAKFKRINEAYEVLRNAEKRALYDRFGHAGVQGRGAARPTAYTGFGDLGDIFEQFFGFGPRQRTPRRPAAERGADRHARITLTFEEAAFGCTRQVEVDRLELCDRCKGTGAEPGSKAESCPTCAGSGQVKTVQQSAFGSFVNVQSCPRCRGRGEIMSNPCRECGTNGLRRRHRKLEVDIPAGVEDGTQIRLSGEGDAGRWGGPPGNLYVVLDVADHPVFVRDGNDVVLEVRINAADAALGTTLEVPTLEGHTELRLPPGAQSGDVFRLENLGIPYLRRSGRGDQLVALTVEIPDKLSAEQRELFERLRGTLPDATVVGRDKGLWSKLRERLA